MLKALIVPLALLASTSPVFAAPVETVAVELADGDQDIAVASACITNTTDYRVVLDANWGIGDVWSRVALSPGDSSVYRLVLDEARAETQLTLRFPAAPTSCDTAEFSIPATWGSERIDDCSLLPQFRLVLQSTDGGDDVFALEAVTAP